MAGESPPCRQKNWPSTRAARGRNWNTSANMRQTFSLPYFLWHSSQKPQVLLISLFSWLPRRRVRLEGYLILSSRTRVKVYTLFIPRSTQSPMKRQLVPGSSPPMQNSSSRSWNCPCVSPHTVTGARTGTTLGSCMSTSLILSQTIFTSFSSSELQPRTCSMNLSTDIITDPPYSNMQQPQGTEISLAARGLRTLDLRPYLPLLKLDISDNLLDDPGFLGNLPSSLTEFSCKGNKCCLFPFFKQKALHRLPNLSLLDRQPVNFYRSLTAKASQLDLVKIASAVIQLRQSERNRPYLQQLVKKLNAGKSMQTLQALQQLQHNYEPKPVDFQTLLRLQLFRKFVRLRLGRERLFVLLHYQSEMGSVQHNQSLAEYEQSLLHYFLTNYSAREYFPVESLSQQGLEWVVKTVMDEARISQNCLKEGGQIAHAAKANFSSQATAYEHRSRPIQPSVDPYQVIHQSKSHSQQLDSPQSRSRRQRQSIDVQSKSTQVQHQGRQKLKLAQLSKAVESATSRATKRSLRQANYSIVWVANCREKKDLACRKMYSFFRLKQRSCLASALQRILVLGAQKKKQQRLELCKKYFGLLVRLAEVRKYRKRKLREFSKALRLTVLLSFRKLRLSSEMNEREDRGQQNKSRADSEYVYATRRGLLSGWQVHYQRKKRCH